MKYIYGIFIGVATLIGLVWVIHLGLEGKPIAKIKLSEFKSNSIMAESILMRLRQEIKDHQIVFLGVDPEEPEHLDLWKHFLQLSIEPGWKFDEIYIEKGLVTSTEQTQLGLNEQIIDIKMKEQELKILWSSSEYREKRIAVIVPQIFSSQLIKDNPVQRLKINPNEGRILSITIVPMGINADDAVVKRLPCAAEGADYTGESPLGCVIRKQAMFWTKPLKKNVKLGLLEQVGLHDFLMFYRPANSGR